MNKGADYEVILGWNNLRNTAKANMHKEDFRINPIVYATKIQINELSIRFLNYLKR